MANNPVFHRYKIGRFTYGRPLVMFGAEALLEVGTFTSIGDGTDILLGGNHHSDWIGTYPFPAKPGF
jgi:hypothetical protein